MRIALTRPEGQNEELAARLRELGHDVVICPLIAIEPLGDDPIELGGYDWLVVTSPNGAREIARRGRGRPKRTAAVGRATADALPWPVDLVPAVSTQEGLLAELPQLPGRVLLAAAEGARGLFVERAGADHVPLYRTQELRPPSFPEVDVVVLASGSAARAFAALAVDVPAVSIGPVTTATAREVGVTVAREARTQDLEGLVEACSSPS